MSRFFSRRYSRLEPYVPGEQPRERKYVKLNTNESPYPPSPSAVAAAREAAARLNLYPDPECASLRKAAADTFGVRPGQLVFTNGSDDALNFAFMAFCSDTVPAVFADITYGFYPVFAALNGVPSVTVPLKSDFSMDAGALKAARGTLFIANPNAPTGISLPLAVMEDIIASDPDRIVVVDEAYVDFGGESCIGLIDRYDNLLVCRTFSKSLSMAGARLGFAAGCEALVSDLETLRYSTNPYNINGMTMAAGIGSLADGKYFEDNCRRIIETREKTAARMKKLGFEVLPSSANFIFVRHNGISGEDYYSGLRKRGVLVRHFNGERIRDFNRITIGSPEEMDVLVAETEKILEEL